MTKCKSIRRPAWTYACRYAIKNLHERLFSPEVAPFEVAHNYFKQTATYTHLVRFRALSASHGYVSVNHFFDGEAYRIVRNTSYMA